VTRLRLEGLTKRYGAETAVEDVSLSAADGEFVVIVGPSGCGKSTTLRLIAGLESATAGRILFDGEPVGGLAPAARDVAMVFQNYALYPNRTARGNIEYGLIHSTDLPPARRRERVREVAALLEVESELDRTPDELSGGQKQRVALGRAIVREPQAFLLDEPLSTLDAGLRARMRREIGEIHRRLDATTVYVTHDQKEAMTMADRVVVMRDGRVQGVGPPQPLYDDPPNRFVAEFIGSPSMNTLPATVGGPGGGTAPGSRSGSDSGSGSGPRSSLTNGDGDGDTRLAIRVDAATLCRLPAGALGSAAGPGETAVVAGIRPEHAGLTTADGPGRIPVTVRVPEYQGNANFVHVDLGDRRLTARTSPDLLPERGATAYLDVSPGDVHLFDPDSGRAIHTRGAADAGGGRDRDRGRGGFRNGDGSDASDTGGVSVGAETGGPRRNAD
jgi:multiple sugar transport system ATP-binding protein